MAPCKTDFRGPTQSRAGGGTGATGAAQTQTNGLAAEPRLIGLAEISLSNSLAAAPRPNRLTATLHESELVVQVGLCAAAGKSGTARK